MVKPSIFNVTGTVWVLGLVVLVALMVGMLALTTSQSGQAAAVAVRRAVLSNVARSLCVSAANEAASALQTYMNDHASNSLLRFSLIGRRLVPRVTRRITFDGVTVDSVSPVDITSIAVNPPSPFGVVGLRVKVTVTDAMGLSVTRTVEEARAFAPVQTSTGAGTVTIGVKDLPLYRQVSGK